MKNFIKKHGVTLLLVAIMSAGLCLLLYPTFSDWWNSFHQSRTISAYREAVEEMSEEEKEAYFQAAEQYNKELAQQGTHFSMTPEEEKEYDSILNLDGNGVMGYISISKINIELPIYHSTEEQILQVAIGHLEGSSLPVGGESTHAVLSGHRGLPSAKLFTDLDQLENGDTFTITVLDRTFTYEVDQIRIVLPTQTSDLAIEDGADYCTLFTCTPYGINTHRMLVRGHRVENEAKVENVPAEAVKVPRYIAVPAVGIPMLFILLLVLLIRYRKIGPKKNLEDIRGQLEQKDRNKSEPAEKKE